MQWGIATRRCCMLFSDTGYPVWGQRFQADGQSLLQKAFLRAVQLPGVDHVLTVTNRELFFKTEDAFLEINADRIATSFILEPFGRNTAPAIAAAALQVAKTQGKDALLLILAADHLVTDQGAFQRAVRDAMALAVQGKIVTFGIQPDAPETGYGYIEVKDTRVLRFVEKPSLQQARSYLASGGFLWNSGMFCFSAGVMLQEMEKYCPEVLAATRHCVEHSRLAIAESFSQLELDASTFRQVPDASIDYALLEKADQIAVVPCAIGWSDIGSWVSLCELDAADASGNRVQGEVLLHNTRNCTVQGNDRLIGAVGVEDLIIIDTADAVLVAHKASAQDVRHLYTALKAKGHDAHKRHRTVHSAWGSSTVLEEGQDFSVNCLTVKPGASLGLQVHQCSKHWIVVSGSAMVLNDEQGSRLNANESIFIRAGNRHSLKNTAEISLNIIEIQGKYRLGKNDYQVPPR